MPNETTRTSEAVAFLDRALAGGLVPAATIAAEACRLGISQRTLERAKAIRGASSVRVEGGWCWTLDGGHRRTAKPLSSSARERIADKVLRWIERSRVESFTRRDAFKATEGGPVRCVADVQAGLRLLERRGRIRRQPRVVRGRGRPVSWRYTVVPQTEAVSPVLEASAPGEASADEAKPGELVTDGAEPFEK